MAGQPIILKQELPDECIRFHWSGTPSEQYLYLGVADRDMWFQRASVRFDGAIQDGVPSALTGHISKVADGTTNATNTDLMTSNSFNFGGTANTTQEKEGLSTSNEIKAGEAIILEFSGTPSAANSGQLVVEVFCLTRRM